MKRPDGPLDILGKLLDFEDLTDFDDIAFGRGASPRLFDHFL
ncbi:MAG: hypothetical protein PW791_04490 [Neorhizobium sp.]|nr:hypothetical protein [Neorhizobium sp.]